MSPLPSRRVFLKNSYLGLGSLALMDLLAGDGGASAASSENPLAPKPTHLPARAKHCIFLFMEGGVSQMDTFEYRPVLDKYAGQQMPSVRGTDLDVGQPRHRAQPHHPFPLQLRPARPVGPLDVGAAAPPVDLCRRHGLSPRGHGRQQQSRAGCLSFPDGADPSRRSSHRGMDDLWPGEREPESARLYRAGTGSSRGGRRLPVEPRFLPAVHQGTLFRRAPIPSPTCTRRPGPPQVAAAASWTC